MTCCGHRELVTMMCKSWAMQREPCAQRAACRRSHQWCNTKRAASSSRNMLSLHAAPGATRVRQQPCLTLEFFDKTIEHVQKMRGPACAGKSNPYWSLWRYKRAPIHHWTNPTIIVYVSGQDEAQVADMFLTFFDQIKCEQKLKIFCGSIFLECMLKIKTSKTCH